MIDIHCHLLPGLDDGPDDLNSAVELARQAVEDGVTHSVVTPHIHPGRWDNSCAIIESSIDAFRQVLTLKNIPLSLRFSAEVRIGPEILPMLTAGDIPFLGLWKERRVLLLELPHSHVPPGTDKMVSWLIKRNILPMIAHPERNKDIMRNLDKLQPLIDLGCLFQMTAGSLVGQFGMSAQSCSEQILKKGIVTVLASDAHHIKRRPVNLSAGYSAAKDIVGEEAARKMVFDNPRMITASLFSAD